MVRIEGTEGLDIHAILYHTTSLPVTDFFLANCLEHGLAMIVILKCTQCHVAIQPNAFKYLIYSCIRVFVYWWLKTPVFFSPVGQSEKSKTKQRLPANSWPKKKKKENNSVTTTTNGFVKECL